MLHRWGNSRFYDSIDKIPCLCIERIWYDWPFIFTISISKRVPGYKDAKMDGLFPIWTCISTLWWYKQSNVHVWLITREEIITPQSSIRRAATHTHSSDWKKQACFLHWNNTKSDQRFILIKTTTGHINLKLKDIISIELVEEVLYESAWVSA